MVILLPKACWVVHVCLQVLVDGLDNTSVPACNARSDPFPLPSQPLLYIETFCTWGLIFVVFANETHLYGMTSPPGSPIYRISPRLEPRNRELEAAILRPIVSDCRKPDRHDIVIPKEQLLTVTGHRAIVLADFLDKVISILPSACLSFLGLFLVEPRQYGLSTRHPQPITRYLRYI